MAAFIAKQFIGKRFDSVSGAIEGKMEYENDAELEAAIAEARREKEEKRKEKHRKMEEEREQMRQDIRNKYGIRKREKPEPDKDPGLEGRIGRTVRTNKEQLVNDDDQSDINDAPMSSLFPRTFEELTTRVSQLPAKLISTVAAAAASRCLLQ